MTKTITKAKAEQVLKSVAKAFPGYSEYGPTLVKDWAETGTWAIVWEEGPYEWCYKYATLTAGYPAKEEEFGGTWKPVKPVKGVWTEPYFSFVLCLYPE